MAENDPFLAINARHVSRANGTEVEFVNAHELAYRRAGRVVILPAERQIAEDGAPDGREVVIAGARWLDGAPLTEQDFKQLVADLADAAPVLRTKLRVIGG